MSRPAFTTLRTALLTSVVCAAALACDSSPADAPTTIAAAADAPSEPASAPVVAPVVAASPRPDIDDQPVLASAVGPSVGSSPAEVTPTPEPAAPTLERRDRAEDSLRSPGLAPEGTPEEHIVAFTHLPLAKRDKAPVGGIGATGIHLDELELGRGWASSRCEELGTVFDARDDERVNLCFRVVHPREVESVTVEWARDGKLRQSIEVGVKASHAYLTRAWMPVSAGRAGDWTATVKSADGSVLGQVAFEIAG